MDERFNRLSFTSLLFCTCIYIKSIWVNDNIWLYNDFQVSSKDSESKVSQLKAPAGNKITYLMLTMLKKYV